MSWTLGLAAACCWSAANLLASRAARAGFARDFPFWFNGFGAMACLPLAVTHLSGHTFRAHDLLAAVGAGLCVAVATQCLAAALRRSPLSVVGPLQSLEGAVAAAIAIGVSGAAPPAVVIGGGLAVCGSIAVSGTAARRSSSLGIVLSLATALAGGAALWAFAQQNLPTPVALVVARVVAAATLAPVVSRWRLPPKLPLVLAASMLDVAGYVAFLLGTRRGGVEATAIMAAQFGTLTALAGMWHWRERITKVQLVGLLLLASGAGLIAAAAS